MIKVVLFDLDNTLIDRQKVFREMLLDQLGQYHPNMNYEELLGVVEQVMAWDNFGNVDRLDVFKKYVDYYHLSVDADTINNYWKEHSGDIVYVFDDAEHVVHELQKKYRLGLLSNGSVESQRRKINRLPFKDVFEYSLVSGELGIHKPDKRIFLKVCEDMGVQPEECVYVGDNPRCDIEGAIGAKMKPIWITKEKYHENKEVICISNLTELLSIL
ncbi:MAG: HAD family hydrolase [Erysipelotrichaceae bacterium]|nr:HAD family hydrolase [Erysipelotrichaceae bacterium]